MAAATASVALIWKPSPGDDSRQLQKQQKNGYLM
jgi:hypothetical protein